MKTAITIILVISIAGNMVGAYLLYKALKLREEVRLFQKYHSDLMAKYEAAKADFAGIDTFAKDNNKLLRETTSEERKKMTVFFGASITKNWDLERYFSGKQLLNRGIGSQTDMQLLARFSADVLEFAPGRVIIKFCSGNFQPKTDIEMVWNEFEMMALMAQRRNIEPILATVIPVTRKAPELPDFNTTKQIQEFNRRLKRFGTEYRFLVVDYFTALADKDGYLPDDMARDPIHPNEKGYEIMAQVLRPILK